MWHCWSCRDRPSAKEDWVGLVQRLRAGTGQAGKARRKGACCCAGSETEKTGSQRCPFCPSCPNPQPDPWTWIKQRNQTSRESPVQAWGWPPAGPLGPVETGWLLHPHLPLIWLCCQTGFPGFFLRLVAASPKGSLDRVWANRSLSVLSAVDSTYLQHDLAGLWRECGELCGLRL